MWYVVAFLVGMIFCWIIAKMIDSTPDVPVDVYGKLVSATPTYTFVPFSMLKALPIEDTHRRYWDSMYYKWEETYHPPIKTVSEKDTPLSRYHFSEDD